MHYWSAAAAATEAWTLPRLNVSVLGGHIGHHPVDKKQGLAMCWLCGLIQD